MTPDEGTSPEIPESIDRDVQDSEESKADRVKKLGAEGGDDSDAADTPPGLPADHDAPLGSTDQHSQA